MKVICDCGAKYAFDASPEMVRNPVSFACPACGEDLSGQIAAMVREQFGAATGPVGLSVSPTAAPPPRAGMAPAPEIAPPPPGAKAVSAAPPTPPPAPPRLTINLSQPVTPVSPVVPPSAPPQVRITLPGTAPANPTPPPAAAPPPVRISIPTVKVNAPGAENVATPVAESAPPPVREMVAPPPVPPPLPPIAPPAGAPPVVRLSHGVATAAAAATPDVKDARFCPKHPQERVTEQCRVCGKPICPKCMQIFGYVCSPLCKEKAELQGVDVPKFVGQRDEVERKQWRKTALIAKLAALLIVALLGTWFWYAWFGSTPHAAFTVRFEDEPAMSGSSAICEGGQIVFIHGAKLARYDLKSKHQIWLQQLVDKKKVEAEAAKDIKEMQEQAAKSEFTFKIPSLDKLTKQMIQSAERSQELRVRGKNIWVADGEKVRRFDWDTGEPKQEVAFRGNFADGVLRGEELEFKEHVGAARMSITRFNLVSGKVQTDEIGTPDAPDPAEANLAKLKALAAAADKSKPGNIRGLTPHQIGAAAGSASTAGKIAAPATISAARNQQAVQNALDEMDDESPGASGSNARGGAPAGAGGSQFRENSTLIPTEKGFIQMTSQMTEKNIVMRSAMKAAPKKSALDGPVNAAATMDIANELLNDMARNSGAGDVREDHSKYKVKLHLGGGKEVPDWEGNVIGEPEIYPQATVNVLVADKKVFVLDQQNKVKWEATLNFPIGGGGSYFEADDAEHRGLGPVVERGDTLYIFDQGVLSAFETATGKARWRLPSVGITGMYFDDAGMIYLNTTTASPDKIKYSRQIDVNDSTGDIVLKLDPRDGKEIWKHSMGGKIAYLSGKFIYTLSYTMPRDDDDEVDQNLAALGLESKPYLRIRRISPKNGRVLWDHYQPRGALDVKIHDNSFQIVFKREVQVLKFISF